MANKEKDGNVTAPVEKELNADSVKSQLEEKMGYHKKLVAEKERMVGELNKVDQELIQNIGGIKTLQSLQKEYFVKDVNSDNGSA